MEFKQSVKEALAYYVYALVDPRDHKIFYIGKGKDNRVFQHAAATIDEIELCMYLQPIITQYFIDNKSEIWLLFLIAHSKR